MSSNSHCAACGRRLSDEQDEDGVYVFDYMCDECSQAQDEHFSDGLAV